MTDFNELEKLLKGDWPAQGFAVQWEDTTVDPTATIEESTALLRQLQQREDALVTAAVAMDYPADVEADDVEAWIDMVVIPDGLRKPTRLKEMPEQGKLVVGAPARWQAVAYFAAKQGLDYYLNSLVPVEKFFVIDLDADIFSD